MNLDVFNHKREIIVQCLQEIAAIAKKFNNDKYEEDDFPVIIADTFNYSVEELERNPWLKKIKNLNLRSKYPFPNFMTFELG